MAYEYEVSTDAGGRWVCTAVMRCDHCRAEVVRGKSVRNAPPSSQDQADASALDARAKAQFAAKLAHGAHSPVVDARGGCTCPGCTARGAGPRNWYDDLGDNMGGRRGARVWRERDGAHGWHAQAARPTVTVVAPPPPRRFAVTALRPAAGPSGWAEPVEVISEPESAEPIVHGTMGVNAAPCIVARPDPVNGGWSVAMLLTVDGLAYATSVRVETRADAQATVDAWVARAPEAVACVRQGARYFPGDARRFAAEQAARRAARGAA